MADCVSERYTTLIPEVTRQVEAASTPDELDDAYAAWLHSLRLPWLPYFQPPLMRNRPGRTRTIVSLER